MKILRIASDIYPSVVGGAPLHVHYISRLQVKMGNEVTVYTTRRRREARKGVIDGYNVERFKPLLTIFGNNIMPSMFRCIRANNNYYDIVHAHSHLYLSTNMCALIRKFGSVPLIITNHGMTSQTAPEWLNRLYLATLGKWTFRMADRVICYTDEEREEMKKLGVDSKKICVIHNGIDTGLFTPGANPKGFGRLLWIGRFVPGKGVDYLINAFSEAVKEKPWLTLTMIGSGPGLKDVRDKIKILGLGEKIHIKEFVPNMEMPAIYQNADIFVLPSLMEGVPRTILEAMACGLPIICTDLPQLRHIVDQCGTMVPVKDSKSLAQAISQIVSDDALAQKQGKCGRARVEKDYSWDDTVRKTLTLYSETISDRIVH